MDAKAEQAKAEQARDERASDGFVTSSRKAGLPATPLGVGIEPTTLTFLRRASREILPDLKPSHRGEAIARGLGFGSHAALVVAVGHAEPGAGQARVFEPAAFAAFLEPRRQGDHEALAARAEEAIATCLLDVATTRMPARWRVDGAALLRHPRRGDAFLRAHAFLSMTRPEVEVDASTDTGPDAMGEPGPWGAVRRLRLPCRLTRGPTGDVDGLAVAAAGLHLGYRVVPSRHGVAVGVEVESVRQATSRVAATASIEEVLELVDAHREWDDAIGARMAMATLEARAVRAGVRAGEERLRAWAAWRVDEGEVRTRLREAVAGRRGV